MKNYYGRAALTIIALLVTAIGPDFGAWKCAAQTAETTNSQLVYDNFNAKWIDPARWMNGFPCGGLSLECVREIEDGQLRLLARNIGWNGSNSGTQWTQSDLFFVNPNSITRITADVTVRQARGTDCPLNPAKNGAQVKVGGMFFNSGSGDPNDDLEADVIANHSGSVVDYGIWWGLASGSQSQWIHITYIPMGTPVTTTIRWDRVKHQFVGTLSAPGGLYFQQTSTYPFLDTTSPVNPQRDLVAATYPPNCTMQPTNSFVEATFDNVIINH